MLGMLLTGLLLRNVFRPFIFQVPHAWTTPLWTAALSAVTARAGLSLQSQVINANLWPTLILGIIPVTLEALFLAGLAAWVFHLPPPWSFTLAFGVSSVSPGVVVPLLLNLMDRPSWKGSRVPPVLLAATGLDVLIATTGFGISLAAIFGHAHETSLPNAVAAASATEGGAITTFASASAAAAGSASVASGASRLLAEAVEHSSWLARAAEELFLGLGGAAILGVAAVVLMRRKVSEPLWTVSVYAACTAAMMALKAHGFPGAGSSCVIGCWAIIANFCERDFVDAANKRLKFFWNLAEPFLFPLIGASVCLNEIRPIVLVMALLVVFTSICVRMAVSFFSAQAAGLSIDEQIFTCGLWAGKASVQAALSTTTIELVHQHKLLGTDADEKSRIVFACMVSAIMLGGPFAAGWVAIFGNHSSENLGDSDKFVEKD
ncbi:Sodium/hydrogen exchanger 9B2 [Entophlyctis sp. JEL0112]|nr:Sodium/hydrogen exchanger 9B2 [Entophlyctis sp. JEL0112]